VEVAVKEGKYIYCIIPVKSSSGETITFGPIGIGDRNDEVYGVVYEDIAAVVSKSPIVSYSVCRENMLAHERAVEEVMKEYTVLPVRFCTIAKDDKKVAIILEKEYDKFKDMLAKIDGKKELSLKAIFDADAVYSNIIEKYKDIKTLKERLKGQPLDKTYYERVAVGRLVETALGEERQSYSEEILGALSPLVIETKINNTYGEKMIVNAAFLVDKDKESEFDEKIQELGAKYADLMKFKYVGTLPPFNFVNLIIETERY